MSLNKVMLIGRLGDEPRLQEMSDGRLSVGLSVVTRMSDWFDVETGEERHRDEWHRVLVITPHLADIARTDLSPGDQIYVEGQLQTQHWQDDTFEWRSLTRIILSRDSDQLRRLGAETPKAKPLSDVADVSRADVSRRIVTNRIVGGQEAGHG